MRYVITAAVALVLAGCGGGATSATTAPPSTSSPPASTTTASSTTAVPAPPGATTPGVTATPVSFSHGIVSAQTASGIAADGTASDPRSSFRAASDRKVVVVLTLDATVVPGTKLGFLRTLDGKFVDSRESSVMKVARSFYFEFAAAAGKSLTPGHYLVKLYVSGNSAGQVTYDVA